MSESSYQLLCDVGRPCPNFQRLIEYVESVDELKGAADLSSRISASNMRWNPRTSRLRTFRNPLLRRRPKFRDFCLNKSYAKIMENKAEALQRKQEEAKQLQDKPIVKIKPNSSSTKSGTILAAQLNVELSRQ
ncbi:hypothetical protein KR032_009588 [Drosophila birchii]|nr:hypothetical protein KR032_009588 [Drosophila birchii]